MVAKKKICVSNIPSCPNCGRNYYHRNGWRERTVINANGTEEVIIVQVVQCKHCKKYHRMLPDTAAKNKRLSVSAIEDIINGKADNVCCELSTMRNIRIWWKKICEEMEYNSDSFSVGVIVNWTNRNISHIRRQ